MSLSPEYERACLAVIEKRRIALAQRTAFLGKKPPHAEMVAITKRHPLPDMKRFPPPGCKHCG